MQDATAAIQRKGLELTDYFDPRLPAVLDGEHTIRVNYETFVFGTVEHRDAFAADVVAACGLLTDPISKRRFRPSADSPGLEHAGVLYLFESGASRKMFARDPERHRLPGFTM